MVMVVGTRGGWERAHPRRNPARRTHNRKGTNPQVQMVNLQECWGSGWLHGCHRCAYGNGNGVGNRRGTRLVSTDDGTFARRIKPFGRGNEKQTLKTIPWSMVGHGDQPKWGRDGRCRRKAGRLGAGELGLGRSSLAVPSKKAEGPLVVWAISVGGGLKSWVDGRRRRRRQ